MSGKNSNLIFHSVVSTAGTDPSADVNLETIDLKTVITSVSTRPMHNERIQNTHGRATSKSTVCALKSDLIL